MKKFSDSINSGLSVSSSGSATVGKTNPAMSSLSSFTKKIGTGLGNIPSITADHKKEDKAMERKQKLTEVLSILEDVQLQCSYSHSGLIIAYTGLTLSPILCSGIKFTWFRMNGDNVVALGETTKSWYPPTVDDIGCMICVQCEDVFEQGCSRYVEVINIDPCISAFITSS